MRKSSTETASVIGANRKKTSEGAQSKRTLPCEEPNIVIHVCDDASNTSKDFTCSRQELAVHMKYFECYLTDEYDDLDISVHCDVEVFQWLVDYMQDHEKVKTLTIRNVVSILVSSEFLQMTELLQHCLAFMKEAINQVLRLPIDLNCISTDVVRRLAKKLTDGEIEQLRDKKDKLQSRLYECKTQQLIREYSISRCTFCQKVFSQRQVNSYAPCKKATIFIDFHGNVLAHHVADKDWDANFCAQFMNVGEGSSFKSIYWRFWGCVHTLQCVACNRPFQPAEYGQCLYHPSEPNMDDQQAGIYPCCYNPVLRFDPSVHRENGCEMRYHTVNTECDVFSKLKKYEHDVCAPISSEECPSPQPSDEDEDVPHSGLSGAEENANTYDIWSIVVPEHRKKGPPDTRRKTDTSTSFFEMKISANHRRDVLREDDRCRIAELLKYRDQKMKPNENFMLERDIARKEKKKTTAPPPASAGARPTSRSFRPSAHEKKKATTKNT
eukprot:GEMP01048096.1.p1 GENE.GEMP01048096.1~~GEMP01048096.1.p1  ORF type:complete len:496 (-),score=80.81 GEMP01048096.1:82-1569(-)